MRLKYVTLLCLMLIAFTSFGDDSKFTITNIAYVDMEKCLYLYMTAKKPEEYQKIKQSLSDLKQDYHSKIDHMNFELRQIDNDLKILGTSASPDRTKGLIARKEYLIIEIKRLSAEMRVVYIEKEKLLLSSYILIVKNAIETLRKQGGYDLILDVTSILYSPKSLNLTPKVIESLK